MHEHISTTAQGEGIQPLAAVLTSFNAHRELFMLIALQLASREFSMLKALLPLLLLVSGSFSC